jgi:hypothetical protein
MLSKLGDEHGFKIMWIMAINFQNEKYINDVIQNRLLNSYFLLTSLSVLMGDTEYTRVKITSLLFNRIEQCCAAHIVHTCQ